MWGSLLYGWLVLTNIATTGATWYASPPARWHGPYAVDEIEILLGCSERCIATATNETGYQAAPMEYVESIRGTNGMMTVTNALTWQLAGKGMLTSNDVAIKAAIPFYVQTNTVTNYTTNMLMHTFTGMVDSLGIGFSNWPYQVEYTNYEDRYKVENWMEWTKRELGTNGIVMYAGFGDGATWAEAYSAAVADYQVYSVVPEIYKVSQSVNGEYNSADPPGEEFFCYIQKTGYTNNIYLTPEIASRASLYVWADKGTLSGETNIFNDFGLGLTENAYTFIDTSTFGTNGHYIYFGGSVVTPPPDLSTPPTTNSVDLYRYTEGFSFTSRVFVLEWQFQYCTNRYW